MKIHVADPSGKQTEHDEQQLRSLWDEGGIDPAAMYWKEGMEGWKPLSAYFSPYATPVPSAPPVLPGAGGFSYVKDPGKLTAFLLAMLWISAAADVISLLSDGAQYVLLGGSYTQQEGEANDARQALLGAGYMGIFLITGISFLRWIHRANLNSRGFTATDMRFTPGWSVGWYFIPILSLVRPYQAMREIWQVSHDPVNPGGVQSGPLLKSWWAFWLLAGLSGQVSMRFSMRATTIADLQASTVVSMLTSVVSFIVTILAIRLVKTIHGRQQVLVTGAAESGTAFPS